MFLTFVSLVVFYFSILRVTNTHRKKARRKDRHRKTKEGTKKETERQREIQIDCERKTKTKR